MATSTGRLWRVTYEQGFGFPECIRRERTSRKYETAPDAARMVATVLRLPSHHVLVSVETTETRWERVDPDELLALVTDNPEGDPDAATQEHDQA